MFNDIRITKRLFGFVPVKITITAKRQQEWADDLIQHNGLSPEQAYAVTLKAMEFLAERIEKL